MKAKRLTKWQIEEMRSTNYQSIMKWQLIIDNLIDHVYQ